MTFACTRVQVLVNGKRVGDLHRDQKPQLSFVMPAADSQASQASSSSSPGSDPSTIPLDVVVQAVGRSNFGCDWDTKGLQSPNVTLNGAHRRPHPPSKGSFP